MNIKRNCIMAFFFFAAILSTVSVNAQQVIWSINTGDVSQIVTEKAVRRESFPTDFKLFNLNVAPLNNQLSTIVNNSNKAIVSLPNADGGIEEFELFEASNFEPELQASFPDIRAFSGRGLTDRFATVKLSSSPQGVSGTIFRTSKSLIEFDGGTEFFEPYSADHGTYAVYRSTRKKGQLPWTCSTEELNLFSAWKSEINNKGILLSNEGTIRTMRLAQSNNGEYSNYFGATSSAQVDLVLAAYNATLTRANGVYEKDLGLHLNVIPQSTSLIFYNPLTDPYSTLANWNNELRNAIIAAGITTEMYDIGHMFGASGGGGNAGCIGCVCTTAPGIAGHAKGRGITSPSDGVPVGDKFDIDFVAHEVGHQLGANHTFSFGQLPIPEMLGQDKEVGSGITVMGYAGITEFDVAPNSIDIFHSTSIDQVQVNLASKGCPVEGTKPNIGNSAPIVAPVTNFTIPVLTPFALTGSATDPDGDPITYTWEQNDSAQNTGASAVLSIAQPAKLIGPNWLTFPATSSPKKLFPRLSTILAGEFVTEAIPGGDMTALIEALSSVTRNLNFRLTVRDNHPYVPNTSIGQTQFTDMTVSVTNLAGPFLVVEPNTNVTYGGGSTQTVIWTVANTNLAPVNTANVNIRLSVDGGITFPILLKENTPNDGSETVVIPNRSTTTARVMVEAVNNIFFDISNANFAISSATAARSSISGRVFASGNGSSRGLKNATVQLTKANGEKLTRRTSSFGYYRFDDIDAGQTVEMSVISKRHNFPSQVVNLNEQSTVMNFSPQ